MWRLQWRPCASSNKQQVSFPAGGLLNGLVGRYEAWLSVRCMYAPAAPPEEKPLTRKTWGLTMAAGGMMMKVQSEGGGGGGVSVCV